MGTIHTLDASAYAHLELAIKEQGQHGITARIQRAIDAMYMDRADSSDGDSTIQVYTVMEGDAYIRLEYFDMGCGAHSFDLSRYKRTDRAEYDFGGLLMSC